MDSGSKIFVQFTISMMWSVVIKNLAKNVILAYKSQEWWKRLRKDCLYLVDCMVPFQIKTCFVQWIKFQKIVGAGGGSLVHVILHSQLKTYEGQLCFVVPNQ